jgi:hypothetical protein
MAYTSSGGQTAVFCVNIDTLRVNFMVYAGNGITTVTEQVLADIFMEDIIKVKIFSNFNKCFTPKEYHELLLFFT